MENMNLQKDVWCIYSGYVDSGYNLIMEKIYPTGERLCFPLNRHLYNVFDCIFILIAICWLWCAFG